MESRTNQHAYTRVLKANKTRDRNHKIYNPRDPSVVWCRRHDDDDDDDAKWRNTTRPSFCCLPSHGIAIQSHAIWCSSEFFFYLHDWQQKSSSTFTRREKAFLLVHVQGLSFLSCHLSWWQDLTCTVQTIRCTITIALIRKIRLLNETEVNTETNR